MNNLRWRQAKWKLGAVDRVLQSYSFAFDPSVWATFWPLLTGACAVLPPAGAMLDGMAIASFIEKQRITIFGAAPSLFSVLVETNSLKKPSSLRHLFSGGEPLSGDLQSALHQRFGCDPINVYGPTEATIDCTYWECQSVVGAAAVPIGAPITGVRVYVLNRYWNLNPPGAPGEIWIGGLALARCYVGDPALTAQKFVPDPFSRTPGGRMYRSGDIGRYDDQGNLHFQGRADDQVKIRGFRIELGEIERTILRHPAARDVAVLVKSGQLIAYVSKRLEQSGDLSPEILAAFLSRDLPKHMIPDRVIFLDALPRLTSGKVDKQALPELEMASYTGDSEYRPPRDALETEIANIVSTALGLVRVSINADIFTLGGNSLLVARIASRLSSAYNINLPVQHLFKDPTIKGIAAVVTTHQLEGGIATFVPWTFEQLLAEAELDSSITGAAHPSVTPGQERIVFVTGATGYLGAFLLERLLRTSDVECFCLARGSDDEHALSRIRDTMQGYCIWDERYRPRVHAIAGDLAKPRLGLSAARFSEIAAEAEVIYHCGALVNFVYPYSALRAANVFGTHEVLRLAATNKLKHVHYVSTVDVLLATHMERPFLETGDVLENPREIPDGYARSKWVAEKMLANARSRGIPCSVYRPGLIMGHTETGATQTNDYLLVGLKGYLEMGILSEPEIMIDFVPVDYAAACILEISRQPDSAGKYFHIWNPRPVLMADAYEWIRSFGYKFDVVSLSTVRDRVLNEVDLGSVLYPFLPIFRVMRDERPVSSHDPSVIARISIIEECRATFGVMAKTGMECPLLNERIAHLCLSYLVSIGFLPQPSYATASA